MPDAPDDWVSATEAAARLGVSVRTARRLFLVADTAKAASVRHVRDGHGRMVRQVLWGVVQELHRAEPDADTAKAASVPVRPRVSASDAGLRGELERERTARAVAEARAALLEQERDRLADALTREQETALKLAERIAEADARLGTVLTLGAASRPSAEIEDVPKRPFWRWPWRKPG